MPLPSHIGAEVGAGVLVVGDTTLLPRSPSSIASLREVGTASSGTDRGAMSSLGELDENTACLTFLMGSVSSSPASTQCHQLTHS